MEEIDKENLEEALSGHGQGDNQKPQQNSRNSGQETGQKSSNQQSSSSGDANPAPQEKGSQGQLRKQGSQDKSQQHPSQPAQGKQMSKEMEIGFYNGALDTLNKERNELVKMVQNVESLMQMYAERLKQLGVNVKFHKDSGQQESQ